MFGVTSKLGPSLELQGAIVTALSADAALKALIGVPPRINPPQSKDWPGSYIEIGEGQEVADLAECIDGSEVIFDIHIWSRGPNPGVIEASFADAKKIAATIWDCLKSANLVLTENRLLPLEADDQFIERSSQQHLRDPDGITKHIVLTLRAVTEPAA
jgi:hypothetical protein